MFIRGIMRKNEINVKAHDIFFSSWVQSLSCAWLFATPWTAARQASLSINSWSSLRLMSIESVMPSNHLILCCPLLLLTSIFPSISVFSNESALCITWPKYWNFSFNASPSNEYPGLIFRMDWLDLFAVQGTLKSLLQHYSSKTSILLGGALDSEVLEAAQVVLTKPWLMMSCHRFRCLSRWVGHINQTGQWWGRRQSARYHLLSSGSLGMSRCKPGIIRASVLLKRRQNARFWLNNTMEFYFLFSKMEALAGIETQTERMDRWTQGG